MLHGVHAGWWPKPLNRFFIDVSIVKSVLNPLGTIIFSLLWKGDMKGTFLKTKHTFYIRRFVNHLDNFSNFILSHPICNRHFSPLLWCGAATSNFNIPSLYQFSIVNAASIVDHSKDPGVEDGVVDNAPPPPTPGQGYGLCLRSIPFSLCNKKGMHVLGVDTLMSRVSVPKGPRLNMCHCMDQTPKPYPNDQSSQVIEVALPKQQRNHFGAWFLTSTLENFNNKDCTSLS